MTEAVHVLAVDLGASGGRVIRGTWEPGGRLSLTEVHRFANEPVSLRGTLHWDILRLFHEVVTGVRQAVVALPQGEAVACLGIDTWGVDFGLLDEGGRLLANPVHYRDRRTDGQAARLASLLGEGTLFRRTGIQDAWFNTVFQLTGALAREPEFFRGAQALLFTPDLINYFFTGRRAAERTIASTSQLLKAGRAEWDDELMFQLGLPRHLFQPVAEPGTLLGSVEPALAADLGLAPGTPVALVPSHDTESAALAVPEAGGEPFVFISCGTWSVLGAELPAPVLSDAARKAGFSNEAGSGGTTCLLRNIMGMWLLQECKRWWERSGEVLDHGTLVDWATAAPAWGSLIDVTHGVFADPGDMPSRIAAFCRATGQAEPDGRGALVRCVVESLACEFRRSLEELEVLADRHFDVLWLVGGGARNRLLGQLSATVTGRVVRTGPAETTALGNVVSQLMALGHFSTASEGRRAVAASFGTGEYRPEPSPDAESAYLRWQSVTAQAPAAL